MARFLGLPKIDIRTQGLTTTFTGGNRAQRNFRPVERLVRRLVEVRLETVYQAIDHLLADSNPELVQL